MCVSLQKSCTVQYLKLHVHRINICMLSLQSIMFANMWADDGLPYMCIGLEAILQLNAHIRYTVKVIDWIKAKEHFQTVQW